MRRIVFVILAALSILGFFLTGILQTSAESRYRKVQWVVGGKPDGPIERARIDGLPTIRGTGPEESTFVDRQFRPRSRPFAIEQRVYLLARLGCLGALLTATVGFFTDRYLERTSRLLSGEAPL